MHRDPPTPLLERGVELARINEALDGALGGSGHGIIIEGPAGIGKTALMERAALCAAERGMAVLSARAGELERNLPFGLVRQLFERPLMELGHDARERLAAGPAGPAVRMLESSRSGGGGADAEEQASLLHGLYWLCSGFAEQGPLLLAVDDVQWADRASLRWLAYLVRRLDELPVLLLLALRRGEPQMDAELVQTLAAEPLVATLRPAPLTQGAVAELVRRLYGPGADGEFCRACHKATGGNPFFSHELIASLAADRVPPTASQAPSVNTVTTEAVSRSVLLRLGRLPSPAVPLAQAVAVLGTAVELRHAAALARVEVESASDAAEALAEASILAQGRPLEFAHPLLRSAVYASIPSGQRSRAHKEAARLLAAEGASADHVAHHLLAVEGAGDEWVVSTLRAAASSVATAEMAATYLRRAMAEPPSPDRRPELLLELGQAETASQDPLAVEDLSLAHELARESVLRARAALDLGRALYLCGRLEEASTTCRRARAELLGAQAASDHEALNQLLVECELLVLEFEPGPIPRERYASLRDMAGSASARSERKLLARLAFVMSFAGIPAHETAALAERSLADDTLLEERDLLPFHMATWALWLADELDGAERHLFAAVQAARRRGSPSALALAEASLAMSLCRRGALQEAQAHAETSLEIAAEHDLVWVRIDGVLCECLVEQARFESAHRALADAEEADCGRGEPAAVRMRRTTSTLAVLRHIRGRLALAEGRAEEALGDFVTAGRLMRAQGHDHPAYYPWRSGAALAQLALGDRAEAKKLVTTELALARDFGSARPVGIALRAAGRVEAGEAAIGLLRQAVDTLADSPARLEHARALTDLGTALRRANRRSDAREPLRRGVELATRCGATALAERAHAELLATGARPRRLLLSGVESLTASERRIADMAAAGMSNREIAQALFVTGKTVEVHLSHVYQKLHIGSRKELPEALSPRGAA